MPTHKEIYGQHAAEYEALISREDYQGNILRSLEAIVSPAGLDILDLGAGTGRLASLLSPSAHSMLAFDVSPHMLTVARDKLRAAGRDLRYITAAADHRRLPLAPAAADLMVAGWSVSYVATWHPDTRRAELESWLTESQRVLRSGGHIVLFESLGTGNELPQRLPHLLDFYDWLDDAGFQSTWIRTDYRFDTPALADELVGFFFGDEIREKIRRGPVTTLPECTGVWWRRVQQLPRTRPH
jgi:ubiquinone/menaquinone biosynthesis C-methylase UbiE